MLLKRRAVSPVIATILIIALTVVAVAAAWTIMQNLNQSNSELVIEDTQLYDVTQNGMVDNIQFTLRNIGTEVANIASVEFKVDGVDFNTWIIQTNPEIIAGGQGILTVLTVNPAEELIDTYTVLVTITTLTNSITQAELTISNEFSLTQIGEAGTVSVGGTVVTVTLNQSYVNPVVVAVPVAASSASVRSGTNAAQHHIITDVTSTSFKIIQSGDLTDPDGVTTTDVNYVVMETGVYYIGSIKIQVGVAQVNGTYGNVTFSESFDSFVPTVLSSTQTNTNNGIPRTRTNLITDTNFRIQLENGADSTPANTYIETIGYIAIEQGSDLLSGLQAYSTADSYRHTWKTTAYNIIYTQIPIVISSLISEDGGQAAYAVVTDITTTDFKAAVEEPTSLDGSHTTEALSWMALPLGTIFGTSS